MDKQTRDDMESMAEWAATQDAWDRLLERRNRPWHRALRFWLSPLAGRPGGPHHL